MFELLQAIPYLWLTLRMSGLAANLIVYPVIMYMCPFYFFLLALTLIQSALEFFFFNATVMCNVV